MMIPPSSVLNRTTACSGNKPSDQPYLVINLVFAGIIVLIMAYSVIFSPEKDNYPVPCIHEKITGEECPSCGISHSFSLIVRGNIGEAYDWNSNGMRVFLFFVAQLLMRIFFSRIYLTDPGSRRELIILDITGSSLLFIITFMPFMIYLFRWI
jgi:hypothetical protein